MSQLYLKYPHISGERRRDTRGRPLHACVLCDRLEPWRKGWSWYGSWKEVDEATPVMKFCPDHKTGKLHLAVTVEMAEEARAREYAIPEPQEATR